MQSTTNKSARNRRALALAIALSSLPAVALGGMGVAGLIKAGSEVTTRPATPHEGTLLLGPADGANPSVTRFVEPTLLSIVFADRAAAQEFYDEAVSNGERVCLADLGPQEPEYKGQRWWLFSC